MLTAPVPSNDEDRLKSLHDMDVLSTSREADFDRITRIAQKVFNTDIALISLVDQNRQWFKSRYGLDAQETGRDISFCGHAIMKDEIFFVENTLEDERFSDNPLVTAGPKIRFYAGQPLSNSEGHKVGTLCIISPKAREFSYEDQETLKDLGRMAELVMENRTFSKTQEELLLDLEMNERDALIDPLTGLWNDKGFDEFFKRETARAYGDKTTFGIAMIELNEIEKVKEEFGLELADEVIKHTASFCIQNARSVDTLACFAENSFVLLIPDIGAVDLASIGHTFLRASRENDKFTLSNGANAFGISMGLAHFKPTSDYSSMRDVVIKQVEMALLAAKEAGGNCFKVQDMQEEMLKNLAMA